MWVSSGSVQYVILQRFRTDFSVRTCWMMLHFWMSVWKLSLLQEKNIHDEALRLIVFVESFVGPFFSLAHTVLSFGSIDPAERLILLLRLIKVLSFIKDNNSLWVDLKDSKAPTHTYPFLKQLLWVLMMDKMWASGIIFVKNLKQQIPGVVIWSMSCKKIITCSLSSSVYTDNSFSN